MDIKSKKQFNNNYQKQESNNKALCRLERKIEKLMYIVSTVTVAPCVIILIILELGTSFLAFTLICYLTWRSMHWFSYGFEHKLCSSTLHIVLWPSYLTVTIGLSLFAFELALNLCLKFIKLMEINVSNIGMNDVTKIS